MPHALTSPSSAHLKSIIDERLIERETGFALTCCIARARPGPVKQRTIDAWVTRSIVLFAPKQFFKLYVPIRPSSSSQRRD